MKVMILLRATADLIRRVIPMGEAGHAGRLQARAWGCALTFCRLDCPSAPGQATVEEMLRQA